MNANVPAGTQTSSPRTATSDTAAVVDQAVDAAAGLDSSGLLDDGLVLHG